MAWKFYDANGSEIQGIGVGAVATANIADDAVTYAKLQDISTNNMVLGAVTAGTVVETTIRDSMVADNAIGARAIASDAIGNSQMHSSAVSGQTAKTTVVDADVLLISDSEASGALKKMRKANLTAGLGGVGLGMVIALGG